MSNYIPHPIDTSKVILPKEIVALVEKLAENTHEIWAQQRMKDGWIVGDQRDDVNLKHPGLVPYSELSESEKDYDRNTALETLKCIVAMGFKIEKTLQVCKYNNRRERETQMKPPFKSYSGDKPYIFISHAHADSADVYPAISALAEKGERVWYDEGIKPGKDWAKEIGIHIDKCAILLWFVSKKSAARKNVTREIMYAKSRNKPILIIYIEDAALTGDNAADFVNLQNIYMKNCTTYGDLADKVKELSKEKQLGTNTGADASENLNCVSNKEIKLEQKRLNKQRTLRIVGLCGVILVLLALFFGFSVAKIPQVTGIRIDEAVSTIDSSKFNYRETEIYSDTVPSGEIISQSPLGGKYGFRFIPIILEVSRGEEPLMTTVPEVVGDEVDFGISKILENMLYFAISAVPTDVKTAGIIDAQDIRAETAVPVETKLGVDVNATSAEEARDIVIDAIIAAGGNGLFVDADGNPIPDKAFSTDAARAVLEDVFVIEDDMVVLGDEFDVDDGKIVLTEENAGELLEIGELNDISQAALSEETETSDAEDLSNTTVSNSVFDPEMAFNIDGIELGVTDISVAKSLYSGWSDYSNTIGWFEGINGGFDSETVCNKAEDYVTLNYIFVQPVSGNAITLINIRDSRFLYMGKYRVGESTTDFEEGNNGFADGNRYANVYVEDGIILHISLTMTD